MFNAKQIHLATRNNHASCASDRDESSRALLVHAKLKSPALDTTALHHIILQSLLYKNHVFNINRASLNMDRITSMMSNALTLHQQPQQPRVTLSIPSNAIQITFSAVANVTFYIFDISDAPYFRRYLTTNLRLDIDLKILQNVLKLAMFYHGTSSRELAAIVRAYLLSEYTHRAVLEDIARSTESDILHLLAQCKRKRNMIFHGTAALSIPREGFEWIAVAMHGEWLEMTMNVFPDRRRGSGVNEHQFHMFIARNFEFSIHRWLHREATTQKLSVWLHRAAQAALDARHIVSRPVARMKRIMQSEGFRRVARDDIEDEIGHENYVAFKDVQGVNDWFISEREWCHKDVVVK